MDTYRATAVALLEEITDPDNLKAINTAVDSLEDNESVALAQAASVGIARLVAAAEALTTRLPRTLGLMDKGQVDGFGAMKVVTATAWLSDEHALAADALLEDRLPGKNAELRAGPRKHSGPASRRRRPRPLVGRHRREK